MALKLNPNYPTAYQWYAITLCALGRFEESLTYINKALVLDPLSLVNNLAKGIILYNSRYLFYLTLSRHEMYRKFQMKLCNSFHKHPGFEANPCIPMVRPNK